MGLEIALEDELGQKIASIEDPTNILHRVLPTPEDTTFRCLNRIDWYGDTVFNRLQMTDLIPELSRILGKLTVREERALIDQIAGFAQQVQSGPHLYLKFYGD
jgi:hypothetical protein